MRMKTVSHRRAQRTQKYIYALCVLCALRWLLMQTAYDSGSRPAAVRRGDDGRDDEFGRGRRDAGNFSGAGLVGASRNNRERHEHARARARRVVERLRLSRGDSQGAPEIPLPADPQRRGGRDRRGIAQKNPACYIRRAGPFSHSLRHGLVYAPGAGSTPAAVGSFGASGGDRELDGRRWLLSISGGGLRRVFRRGDRHPDAGRARRHGIERHPSDERLEEHLRLDDQWSSGRLFCVRGAGRLAVGGFNGRGRDHRRVRRGGVRAPDGTEVRAPRRDSDRIRDGGLSIFQAEVNTMQAAAPKIPNDSRVDLKKVYDAIIVGSGAAGGMAAYVLASAGMKTLLLEAGRRIDTTEELKSTEWPYEHQRRGEMPPDRHALTLNEYTIRKPPYAAGLKANHVHSYVQGWGGSDYSKNIVVDEKDHPYTGTNYAWVRARCLGGKTNIWGRLELRLWDYEFQVGSCGGWVDVVLIVD